MRNKVIAFTVLISFASVASAQKTISADENDSIDDKWNKILDEVVVTGTRTPKLVTNSPILTRVISSSDIRKSDATNISDLLQTELPGIEFSYSMNQQVSLNMQGFGGNSVLFLIDGERLAGETLDNVDYDRLNLNNAGKIEIVKGAASSLYGSNAVGGVVNIISREASEPWTLNVNGRYGKHNSQRYGATFTVNKWKINSSTSAQFSSIDSYNMKNEGDYSKYYGGKTWNINERLTFKPINALKLIARAGYFFRERNSQATTRDRYRDFSGGLRGIYEFAQGTNLEVSYSFDQYDKSDYILLSRKDVRDYSNVQNIGKAVFNHTFGGKHILTVGGDVMRDYLMSYQFTDNGTHKQVTADGFAQIDLTFNKLNVIAGGRYDYFSESDMKHFSSRINLMYNLDRFKIRGSYAGGFRAPTLKEMYMDFDMASIFMIYGNPDLKPERSHNFSLSVERNGQWLNGAYSLTASGNLILYDNRITISDIDLNGSNEEGARYYNESGVKMVGVDLTARYRTNFGLGFNLSGNYLHAAGNSIDSQFSQPRRWSATWKVDYERSFHRYYKFYAALSGRYLGKPESKYETDGAYSLLKLTLRQSVWRGIDINMTADNLLNYRPKIYYWNSAPTAGISFSIGLSLNLTEIYGI